MLTQPACKSGFVHLAGSHREHRQCAVSVVGGQPKAIQVEKEFNSHEGGALVAVYEGVVARDAEAVGGGQVGRVRLRVGREVVLNYMELIQCMDLYKCYQYMLMLMSNQYQIHIPI